MNLKVRLEKETEVVANVDRREASGEPVAPMMQMIRKAIIDNHCREVEDEWRS